jgi:NADPH2:quinone reductase
MVAPRLVAWGGATVIGTVRRSADLDSVAVALDEAHSVAVIREFAPDGVDRVPFG